MFLIAFKSNSCSLSMSKYGLTSSEVHSTKDIFFSPLITKSSSFSAYQTNKLIQSLFQSLETFFWTLTNFSKSLNINFDLSIETKLKGSSPDTALFGNAYLVDCISVDALWLRMITIMITLLTQNTHTHPHPIA